MCEAQLKEKQLDSYSLLIVSKYFWTKQDYINIICVCKKFQETTEKLRYNPIPVTNTKLFPKMETQYQYKRRSKIIKQVKLLEKWFMVNYDEYLRFSEQNIKCHYIKYTKQNRILIGNEIPSGVKLVGQSCFCDCKIVDIQIPNSVTSLEDNCFYHCSYLTSIALSTKLYSMGYYCFSNCESLKSITLPPLLTKLSVGTFSNCTSLTNIKLPPKLEIIGNACFKNCISLSTLTLPSSLIQIEKSCFENCGLQSLIIPEHVCSFDINCLKRCSSLKKLEIGEYKNEYPFEVSYNDSILFNQYGIKCPYVVFNRIDVNDPCQEIRQQDGYPSNFIIPNGVLEICRYAFSYKIGLTNITIPTTVTRIGEFCFESCSSLTSLSIPDSVKSIDICCFRNCKYLASITLPTSLLDYGYKSFEGCNLLKDRNVIPDEYF